MFFVVPIYKIIITSRSRDLTASVLIVMARGTTLEEFIANNPHEKAAIYPYLVSFVHDCHENKVFHLDIRPSKILVEPLDYAVQDLKG